MYKRIVVKVGTKVLSSEDGTLDSAVLRHLVEQVVLVKNKGIEVVLVTSGAMGAGRGLLTLKTKEKVAEKQVLAAVGQVKLMSMYAELFAKKQQLCAQVLVTKEDFRDKTHYLNMRTCFENLLKNGVVPVVNENDVVATTELLFTDNDELAGLVASQLNADAVLILTSVEGFLAGDPADPNSKVIPLVDVHSMGRYQKYISPEKTTFGRGGMLTKFTLAKKLALQGVVVHFGNGKRRNIISEIIAGKEIGTKFLPKGKSSSLKRRLAYSEGLTKGSVEVNECAEEVLLSKTKIASLLPVGVVKIQGDFSKGDIIEILGPKKKRLGFGVAEYSSASARNILGTKRARPMIHYNHMFIGA